MQYTFDLKGMDQLRKAVAENPQRVATSVAVFIKRAVAEYTRIIWNNPWKMGMVGGGVPTATQNLRDTHLIRAMPWDGLIKATAPYAGYVHGWDGATKNVKGVQLRPWLDYAFVQGQPSVDKLEEELLNNIMSDFK
jgi:hypothetical protein